MTFCKHRIQPLCSICNSMLNLAKTSTNLNLANFLATLSNLPFRFIQRNIDNSACFIFHVFNRGKWNGVENDSLCHLSFPDAKKNISISIFTVDESILRRSVPYADGKENHCLQSDVPEDGRKVSNVPCHTLPGRRTPVNKPTYLRVDARSVSFCAIRSREGGPLLANRCDVPEDEREISVVSCRTLTGRRTTVNKPAYLRVFCYTSQCPYRTPHVFCKTFLGSVGFFH